MPGTLLQPDIIPNVGNSLPHLTPKCAIARPSTRLGSREYKWAEAEIYARNLIGRHGAYFLSAWHALLNSLCAQNRFVEARTILNEAIAHWPHDAVLQAIELKIDTNRGNT